MVPPSPVAEATFSTRSSSASSGGTALRLLIVRHWHLAPVRVDRNWLPRRRRACPSAALDERVLTGKNSARVPYAATRYGASPARPDARGGEAAAGSARLG